MSFLARYAGECDRCDEPVRPGQKVDYDVKDNLIHVLCPFDVAPTGAGTTCPVCFEVKSVSGACACDLR